jgi:hypothetical protein
MVVKPSASAWFTSFHHEQQQQQQQKSQNRRIPSMLLQMAKEEEESASMEESSLKNEKENTTEPTMDRPEVPSAGSSAELLYALGVNLARQLGDVRPLVESGDELAQVAKGMLDAVIGKLTEDGQRDLLTRRGAELNELITERA